LNVGADPRLDSGKCAIEIDQTVNGSMVVDGSTGEIMAASAWKLIRQCADTQGSGGRVSGLGKFENPYCSILRQSLC